MIFNINKNQLLSELTDEELIAGIQANGNKRYVGELFNRYIHLVYGICLKYVKNKEECKDIAMSIFEKMLMNLPSTEIQMFKKWLYIMTRNQCINFLREQYKKIDEPTDLQELEKKSEIFMENEDFLRPINKNPDEAVVQVALKQLKPDQRKCMELFFYKDMSYKQIEEKTEYTAKQIKSFLQNGKRKLKLILESNQVDSGN
jgi:RNA polymerase sigma-70 factor (ECF subfamily)